MLKRYYFTTDNTNALTAANLAEQKGFTLEVVDRRDLARLEREQADVILDWDFSPEDERKVLLTSSSVNVVGVHGFTISEAQAGFLSRRGLVCSSRLDKCFFDALDHWTRAA